MKKRIFMLLLALCVLLIPQFASANAPAPDPFGVKIDCRSIEVGTSVVAMFAGEDGVFEPDAIYGERKVSRVPSTEYFHFSQGDTQLYLKVTAPDGTVRESNVLPITPNGVYRYDGATNTLTDRTGSFAESGFASILLFVGVLLLEIAAAFALTILIELLVGLCFRMKPLRYIVFANLITNIPMNIVLLLISTLSGFGYWFALTVFEAIVLLIEFFFWRRKYASRKTWVVLLFTVAANAASLAAGVLLIRLLF